MDLVDLKLIFDKDPAKHLALFRHPRRAPYHLATR